MSRIGKKPIQIPGDTKISYKDRVITVTGKKGSLERTVHEDMDLEIEDNVINVVIKNQKKTSGAFQGMTRALINNMVVGVSEGFTRVLEINGIGYRADVKGDTLNLNLGFSHPIEYGLPKGITAAVDKNNTITLSGIDKELLGHVASSIRAFRPPEPYKGKGIKYADEYIQKKAGKTGTK
jgi:large subunit ribosomal protein L6